MLITSDISGKVRVVVKGKGWVDIKKIKPADLVKTKEGWKKVL